MFDLPVKEKRLRELEFISARPDFWDDPEKATAMLKEQTQLSDLIDQCHTLCSEIEDARVLLEMAHEEADKEAEADVARQLDQIKEKIRQFSLDITLDHEDD
ncbi:MAG: PCRF domain-containing protein, partial [Desulfotignum sp.]